MIQVCRRERDTNSPRDHPGRVRVTISEYYAIRYLDNGTADVFLFPEGRACETDCGRHECDADALVVCGVIPWNGLEEDIRKRYDAWCKSGDTIIPRKERKPMKPEINTDEIMEPIDQEEMDEVSEAVEYEAEDADVLEADTIFILKDGEPVEMEVPDDAEDDQA